MPPWKPVEGYGNFCDSYALTDAEKQMILSWIGNGMPRGPLVHERDRVSHTEAWPLGEARPHPREQGDISAR